MSMFVNTNVSALNAQRQLTNSSNALSQSFERLSSGFRINSASDDAAGLQISDRMTSQINGLNQAVRNANDGISLAQTAEGALNETTNSLQRIRQLAVQSQSGINSDEDQVAMQKEITALVTEIDRIANDTEFNNQRVFNSTDRSFLVGAEAGQTITVKLDSGMNAADLGDNTNNIADIDITAAAVSGSVGAADALAVIDGAISKVNGMRADLGAVQNRFDSTIRNLTNVSENTASARSRIRDTDFATETAELTRNQILQQASSTILAQANQRPQSALQLLG